MKVELNEQELRYLLSCGAALLQNIPEEFLATYTNFSKEEIIDFTIKIRTIMDNNNIKI